MSIPRLLAVLTVASLPACAWPLQAQPQRAPQSKPVRSTTEKLRIVGYIQMSDHMAADFRALKAMGFNAVLSQGADAPVSDITPLIEAADRYGIRIIWTDGMVNQFANPRVAARTKGHQRRFVGADGNAFPDSGCPADPVYWRAILLDRALPLAQLAAKGHPAAAGLLLDNEDYSGIGNWSKFCLCKWCFSGFLKSAGKESLNVAPADRNSWLVDNALWDDYTAYQEQDVVRVLKAMRAEIDKAAPSFLLATYPWPMVRESDRGTLPSWDLRLPMGLGTEIAPFAILDESTYVYGYNPHFAHYHGILEARGLKVIVLPGFDIEPAKNVWWPEDMAAHAYWSSRQANGYWIFRGSDLLLNWPAGKIGPLAVGGKPEDWVAAFTRVNRAMAAAAKHGWGAPQYPPIVMRQFRDLYAVHYPTDLWNRETSQGDKVMIRRWTDIGLPWSGGEMVLLADSVGDFLRFDRPISRPDKYRVYFWFTRGPDRPKVAVFVDGKQVGDPVDLYLPRTAPAPEQVPIGDMILDRGNHRWELRAVGKNPASTGCTIGFTAMSTDALGVSKYPAEWWVIGPFDNTGPDQPGFDAIYPPEREIDLAKTYTGKAGVPAKWQRVRASEDGALNLRMVIADSTFSVAYALTYVFSPEATKATILLGSDDGAKVFVNGEEVWGYNVARSAEPDEDRILVKLKQGWNALLVKSTQVREGWRFYARLDDPDARFRYSLQPR